MKNFLHIIILLAIFCFLSTGVQAQEATFYDFSDEAQARYDIENQNDSYKNLAAVKPEINDPDYIAMALPNVTKLYLTNNQLFIPKGTAFTVMLNSAISSESTQNNDTITAQLTQDWTLGGYTIAPEGSIIQGSVIKNQTAGAGMKNGEISIIFNKIIKPDGEIINISTNKVVVAIDGSRLKNIGIQISSGVLSGALVANSLETLVLGVGAGAVFGLMNAATSRGENVSLPEGTNFKLTLASDLRVEPYEY